MSVSGAGTEVEGDGGERQREEEGEALYCGGKRK
ncbi:hypothetical protein A2U01_0041385, partial [Trifolium medium]|nr:hypothetical protein [Trifolium medium]